MKDRYIKYEDAIKVIEKHRCRDDSCRICGYREECRTPTEKRELKKLVVEATPVRHGHWEHDETGANFCSVCNEYPYDDGEYHLVWHTDFCPNCGAKMDEEVKQE